jgi:hypothetical protein
MSREGLTWIVCGAIALVLIGLVLFGGGGGSAGNQSAVSPHATAASAAAERPADRSAIEQLLTRTLTQNDPKQCTQDMTPSFLRQSFGSEKGTLDRCHRANTPQSAAAAKSVAVESITAPPMGLRPRSR